jgi:septum formation protein
MFQNAGLTFSAIKPDVDEGALTSDHPEWTPAETAHRLAEAKAVDVSRRNPGALTIGADQVLALGDRIFSKPHDRDSARHQLQQLRNKSHELISAVVCAVDGKPVWHHSDSARLRMRDFSDEFLESYLTANGDRTMMSVGGYQIEGLGIQLFDMIEGDFYTILGLPVLPLLGYLRKVRELTA